MQNRPIFDRGAERASDPLSSLSWFDKNTFEKGYRSRLASVYIIVADCGFRKSDALSIRQKHEECGVAGWFAMIISPA